MDPRTLKARWGAVLATGFPALLALAFLQPSDLSSPGQVLNFLGRVAGITGLTALLLAAALSSRVPGFDRRFGGLTKLWQTHHLLGAAALILLMLHPILLALAASESSPAAAANTLIPRDGGGLAIGLGWLALVLMMVFLAPSFHFFGRPDYARWKWLHRLAGPVIVLALGHTLMFGRTLPSWLESVLWLILASLAVSAVVYRFIFSRTIGRLRYSVKEVVNVANNLVELVLQPVDKRRLAYQAGQFVYLAPYDRQLEAGYAEEHPYTLSSSPADPLLRIAIKDLGDASRAIQTIRPGSTVTIEGPYGAFFPEGSEADIGAQLWIAGGIGITPFLGRARDLERRAAAADIHLIYCVQDEARARFIDELKVLSSRVKGLRVTPHYFYQHGPLNAAFISRHCPDWTERLLLICGPPGLNELAHRLARDGGVPKFRIRTEEFDLL